MERLLADPPNQVGSVAIDRADDLREGYAGLPPTEGLRLGFADGRIFIRPSGTEPKLKCYVEVVDADEILARARLDLICAGLRDYLDTAVNAATSTGTTR